MGMDGDQLRVATRMRIDPERVRVRRAVASPWGSGPTCVRVEGLTEDEHRRLHPLAWREGMALDGPLPPGSGGGAPHLRPWGR